MVTSLPQASCDGSRWDAWHGASPGEAACPQGGALMGRHGCWLRVRVLLPSGGPPHSRPLPAGPRPRPSLTVSVCYKRNCVPLQTVESVPAAQAATVVEMGL